MKKTDNSNLSVKLDLRRYFIEKYGAHSVLDCCQGDKYIWSVLLAEMQSPPIYLGVDIKPKKGRLSLDSSRILQISGWNYDIIDIDTYGSPWRHYTNVLINGDHDITVFLTIGMVKVVGGAVSNEVKKLLGFDKLHKKIPSSIINKFPDEMIEHGIYQAKLYGFDVIEALQAPSSRNARYVGIRLAKQMEGNNGHL